MSSAGDLLVSASDRELDLRAIAPASGTAPSAVVATRGIRVTRRGACAFIEAREDGRARPLLIVDRTPAAVAARAARALCRALSGTIADKGARAVDSVDGRDHRAYL